ncbi:MAG: hypothetical protein KDA72_16400, partial [Planctomycetales bacterium]|nr:hypothetical protein [Planctomycetales bacterium]
NNDSFRVGSLVYHEKHEGHEKLALFFFVGLLHRRFHPQNLLVDDSFILFFVNFGNRSHGFATFIFEQNFSIAHYLVADLAAGPPRIPAKIFSCPSCVSWLIVC